MARQKISTASSANTLTGTEILPALQGGEPRTLTTSRIASEAPILSGGINRSLAQHLNSLYGQLITASTFPPVGLDIVGWWDAIASNGITTDSNGVLRLSNWSIGGQPLAEIYQGTTRQPALTSNRVVFDGSNDVMRRYPPVTIAPFVSATQLPDGVSGEYPTKGFTCTGLARAANGTWWVGNHGRHLPTDTTSAPSIVHLSADFTTLLGETLIPGLTGSDLNTCQGVTIDPRDGSIWAAVVDNAATYNRCYHFASDGSYLAFITLATGFTINGLVWDPVLNVLIVSTSEKRLRWVDPAAPTTTIKAYRTAYEVDHLFYDQAGGSIYYSYDPEDGTDGEIARFDLTTLETAGRWKMTGSASIEGIYKTGTQLYLMNDAGFHGSLGNTNAMRLHSLPTLAELPALGTRFQVAGIAKLIAAPAADGALVSLGSALENNQITYGVNLMFTASVTTSMKLVTSDGQGSGNRTTATLTFTTNSEFLFFLDVDCATKIARFFVNGVQVGADRTMTHLPATLGTPIMTMGANFGSAYGSYANCSFGSLSITRNAQARQAEIEGAHAWKCGVTSLLPSDHAYKLVAP